MGQALSISHPDGHGECNLAGLARGNGHGDISGEDFWREKPDKTTARLVLDGEPKSSSGPKGVLEVALAMMGAKGNRLGTIGERYEFVREGNGA